MMKVAALCRKSGKDQPLEHLDRWGLEAGDGEDNRQISLLPGEAREAVERMGKRGLCMERFYANLEIAGLPALESGQRLTAGDAVLEVTDVRKKCFPECLLVREGADCPLKTGCRFARVVRGGTVAVGDAVALF